MAKRFIDTTIWDDEWFQDLSPHLKCFWIYICNKCDNCGVWKINRKLVDLQIGSKVDIDKAILNEFSGRIIRLSGDKLFVRDFITFQYGKLSEECKPHKQVFELLQKYNISYPIDTLSIPFEYPIDRVQDKDKDKDKKEECINKSEFEIAFDEFCKMRTRIKKPLTDHAKNLIKSKLNEISSDESTQIKILDQSTANSWQGVFPLNNQTKGSNSGYERPSAVRSIASEYANI